MADGEKCNNKDCKTIITEKRKKDGQYKKYCCPSCRRLGVTEKCKQTSLEKYGVSNPSKSKIIKDRIKESFTEKYGEGITNSMHLQEFRDKIVETNIEKYGTDKPQLLEEFKNKSKDTCIEKYGVEKPQRLQLLKDKSTSTCEERYGVSAPQKNKSIRQKSIDTCVKKYSAENVMQSKDVFDKNRYYQKKNYTLPSGNVVKIQGYEDKCIGLLLKTYLEDELYINPDLQPIYYIEANNIKHRYYPDIYIPKDNLIIEVKSQYTYNGFIGWYNTNLLKRQACIDAGYNFKFMIFDKMRNLLEEIK
jgi:hypothetical protein